MHPLSGCKVKAEREYPNRHINALKILATEWGRQKDRL